MKIFVRLTSILCDNKVEEQGDYSNKIRPIVWRTFLNDNRVRTVSRAFVRFQISLHKVNYRRD